MWKIDFPDMKPFLRILLPAAVCGLLLGGAGAFVLVKYRRNSARHRADNDFMLDDDDESAE